MSVCIITYNSDRTIDRCLSAVFEQDYARDGYEVIVVDAGSTDKTASICSRYPMRFISLGRVVRGAARNVCIQQARGSIIAMVDSDEILPKHWLRRAADRLQEGTVDAVSGPQRTPKPPFGIVGEAVYLLSCTRGPQTDVRDKEEDKS